MNEQSRRSLLVITLLKQELKAEDLIVCIACKSCEKAMENYATEKEIPGMFTVHQMQDYIDNLEAYARNDRIVEMLWDCLNQVMAEE